jgi:glutathione S-transferase
MNQLHKFGAFWRLHDISPFCAKVETYARMTGVPYEPVIGNSQKAPRGKFPVWVGDDGRTIVDSELIVRHLEAAREVPLDAGLSPRERAVGEAFRVMLEEHHYFVMLFVRWGNPASVAMFRPAWTAYFDRLKVPRFVQGMVLSSVARTIHKQLHNQGTGRHTREDVMNFGVRHWSAVADQLGDAPFLLGERPRTVDATVYAFLSATLDAPFESRFKDHVLADRRLVDYHARMRERFWAGA